MQNSFQNCIWRDFSVKHEENTDLRFLEICCWPLYFLNDNNNFLNDNNKMKVLRNVKLQNLKVLPSWR